MKFKTKYIKKSVKNILWEIFCLGSVVGIWPRHIEPNLIATTRLSLPTPNLPSALEGLKILQFSDLHLSSPAPKRFLKKIINFSDKEQPDIVAFTGDFLNFSNLGNPDELQQFLCAFDPPYGCFAVLGNHDYQQYASVNSNGEYDVEKIKEISFSKTVSHLLKLNRPIARVTKQAQQTPPHRELMSVLASSPFKLLHNENHVVKIGASGLNITGIGEYMLGRADPKTAFKNYHSSFPGITLAHNPDSAPLLEKFPGNLILSGHTHGAQINLPWLWKRITKMENYQLKRGLYSLENKKLYINRGVSGSLAFRWFSLPEILIVTLKNERC